MWQRLKELSCLWLIIASILLLLIVMTHSTNMQKERLIAKPYSECSETEEEHIEMSLIHESPFGLVRRYLGENRVYYELYINEKHIDDIRTEINNLSTNLYLMWKDNGLELGITILVLNSKNSEIVQWYSENGRIEKIW